MAVSAAGALAFAAFAFWPEPAGPLAALHVDGIEVGAVDDALAHAEAELAEEAERAELDASSVRCWVEIIDAADEVRSSNRVLCGPVWFPAQSQPWVEASIRAAPADEDGTVVVEFDRLVGTTALDDEAEYVRPDGEPIPPDEVPQPAERAGIRLDNGRWLQDFDGVLEAAQETFTSSTNSAAEPRAVQDDALCWFETEGGALPAGGFRVLCGPVLAVDGDAAAPWASIAHTAVDASFWSARAEMVGDVQLGARAMGDDLTDGRGGSAPAVSIDPPLPLPQALGFSDILDRDLELAPPSPAERLLIRTTDGRELTIEGHAQMKVIGSGPDALVAAEGEIFIALRTTDGEGPPASAILSPYLQIDGDRQRVDPDVLGSTWVVSVPVNAGEALLILREERVTGASFEQAIDLLTGARADAGPRALYRPTRQLTDAQRLSQRFAGGKRIQITVIEASFAVPDSVESPADADTATLRFKFTANVDLDPQTFRLRARGDVLVAGRQFDVDENGDTWVTFEVPDDLVRATLVVRATQAGEPTRRATEPSTVVVDFGPAS
ncbi:MAG: hypothetical protein ACE367_25245 [Acidimicrobiales bacterium]